jgi:anti-sigma B factor antagonist
MTTPGTPPAPGTLTITARLGHDRTGAGAVVLGIAGEVDLATQSAFDAAIAWAVRDRPEVLVIDLTAVTFLSSTALVSLVRADRTAAPGTAVRVATGAALRTFVVSGLDQLLAVYPTVPEALAATRTGHSL